MNSIREIQSINTEELRRGIAGTAASWHDQYRQCAWVYIGNVDKSLSEGDLLAVFSQWGEIEDIHLVRDEETTGISRGFAFLKYEDPRSCGLAVDNFCGILLCGRPLRVDHVENYRVPKHILERHDGANNNSIPAMAQAGHAYVGKELANEWTLQHGQDLFAVVDATKTANKPHHDMGHKHERGVKKRRTGKRQNRDVRQSSKFENQEKRKRRERKLKSHASDESKHDRKKPKHS